MDEQSQLMIEIVDSLNESSSLFALAFLKMAKEKKIIHPSSPVTIEARDMCHDKAIVYRYEYHKERSFSVLQTRKAVKYFQFEIRDIIADIMDRTSELLFNQMKYIHCHPRVHFEMNLDFTGFNVYFSFCLSKKKR
jgi:hypothetical protein